ncbi:hypothetical protein D3C73_1244620 [compost metagenome]
MIRNIRKAAAELHYSIVAKLIEWNGNGMILSINLSSDVLPLPCVCIAEYRNR